MSRSYRRLGRAERTALWSRFRAGDTLAEIATALGRSAGTVQSVVRATGGIAPRPRRRSARALTAEERETIARLLETGTSARGIARVLGRPPSTVSRELARNGGRATYRATAAEDRAWAQGQRPKVPRLVREPALAALVAARLADDWSPGQIAGWLRRTHPTTPLLHVSAETIYRALFVQARGTLKRELTAHLRSRRPLRRDRTRAQALAARPARLGQIVGAVSIAERPPSAADRALPGHWEGDLLMGGGQTVIATLVERHSRYVHLVQVATKETAVVVGGLIREVRRLPGQLIETLTWDRGHELQQHARFTVATDVQVYFCDPRSPWQRGSNENTNGLLRQYFPKGARLDGYTQAELDAVAHRLNTRPRQTLGFRTPAEVLHDAVAATG